MAGRAGGGFSRMRRVPKLHATKTPQTQDTMGYINNVGWWKRASQTELEGQSWEEGDIKCPSWPGQQGLNGIPALHFMSVWLCSHMGIPD
jgi:hypothetical protein